MTIFNNYFQSSNLTEGHAINHVEKQSLADLTTHAFLLFVFLAFALLNIKTNSLTIEHVNQYPHYMYLYNLQFLAPSLMILSISIVQYMRHYQMRQAVWKEFGDFLYCIE